MLAFNIINEFEIFCTNKGTHYYINLYKDALGKAN